MLPPRRPVDLTDKEWKTERSRIAVALATRFGVTPAVARRHVPRCVISYGKVRRTDGGDTMNGAAMVKKGTDGRDASFVRVRDLLLR